MHWLSSPGFLGTGAPRFSDIVVIALLLVLAGFILGLRAAGRGEYRTHARWMGTTYLVLAAVVSLFVTWTRLAPQPLSPRLLASALRRAIYSGLMPTHIGISLMGLALGLASVPLGRLALSQRAAARNLAPRWGRPHRVVGVLAFSLLALTSLMGLGIYALRYL